MRIVYIARHGGHDNDDEGAIGFALEQLGHQVIRLPETCKASLINAQSCDFVLSHKWEDFSQASQVKHPLVFWYFDLLCGDAAPQLRIRSRRRWIHTMTKLCAVGFCTDGDWVSLDRTGKLHCLDRKSVV